MSVITTIATLMSEDTTLSGILTGGVYTRSLKRNPPGATAEAFSASGQIIPSAVVKDQGDNADDAGPIEAFSSFPQIWLYAPTTATGRAAIENAFLRIFSLLHARSIDGLAGAGVGLRVIGRQGINDDPVLPATLVDMVRLQADGLWRGA